MPIDPPMKQTPEAKERERIAPTPELIEIMCQAREIVPGAIWTDSRSEGVIAIERMLAERQLKALAAHLNPGQEG